MAQKEIEINTKPKEAAKDVKKKAKNVRLEDMKKGSREKPLMESTIHELTTLI